MCLLDDKGHVVWAYTIAPFTTGNAIIVQAHRHLLFAHTPCQKGHMNFASAEGVSEELFGDMWGRKLRTNPKKSPKSDLGSSRPPPWKAKLRWNSANFESCRVHSGISGCMWVKMLAPAKNQNMYSMYLWSHMKNSEWATDPQNITCGAFEVNLGIDEDPRLTLTTASRWSMCNSAWVSPSLCMIGRFQLKLTATSAQWAP